MDPYSANTYVCPAPTSSTVQAELFRAQQDGFFVRYGANEVGPELDGTQVFLWTDTAEAVNSLFFSATKPAIVTRDVVTGAVTTVQADQSFAVALLRGLTAGVPSPAGTASVCLNYDHASATNTVVADPVSFARFWALAVSRAVDGVVGSTASANTDAIAQNLANALDWKAMIDPAFLLSGFTNDATFSSEALTTQQLTAFGPKSNYFASLVYFAYLENVLNSGELAAYEGLFINLDGTGTQATIGLRPDSSIVFRFRVDSLRVATDPIKVAVVLKTLPLAR